MKDWRGREGGPDRTKLGLAAGVVAGLAVLAWMFLARAGEERVSSNGFDTGGALFVGAAPRPLTSGTSTGLSLVRLGFSEPPPSARAEALPATVSSGAPAPSAPTTAAASAPASPAPSAAPADSSHDLAAIGVSAEPKGLARLGAEKGLLSAVVAKALEHPAALRALLNNKTLVNAYFSRDLVKSNCGSGSALKSYLMNGSAAGGVSEEVSIVRDVLKHPDAAASVAGTEFGSRLMNCPSVSQLAQEPGAVMQIAGANPGLMGLVADPGAMQALASNPRALSLLSGVQSSLGGGAPGAP